MGDCAARLPVEHTGDKRPILLFDGTCGVCFRIASFIVARCSRVRVMDLHSHSAVEWRGGRQLPNAALFVSEEGRWLRSDAMLRGLAQVGGAYRSALLLLWIPVAWRDTAYRWIVSNRNPLSLGL